MKSEHRAALRREHVARSGATDMCSPCAPVRALLNHARPVSLVLIHMRAGCNKFVKFPSKNMHHVMYSSAEAKQAAALLASNSGLCKPSLHFPVRVDPLFRTPVQGV